MSVEKQRFGYVNFSGGEIIWIGQFFAVGSLGNLESRGYRTISPTTGDAKQAIWQYFNLE